MLPIADNSDNFEVKLELFDGPIDLLLHLVKDNALPIEKLSLAAVADQYMQCVSNSPHLDLELAGEYLVIAATLLSIKAAVLLNKKPELVVDDQGNLIDPHEELLRRLKEAAVYKESAEKLSSRDLLNFDVFAAESSLNKIEDDLGVLAPHNAALLAKAFRKLISKGNNSDLAYTVSFEKISIVERMMAILKTLEDESSQASGGRPSVEFSRLVPEINRNSLVASFVALLELCKRQIITLEQSDVFDEIYVVLSTDNYKNLALESEFDELEGKQTANA